MSQPASFWNVFFKMVLDWELGRFRNYLNTMDLALKGEVERFEAEIERQKNVMTAAQADHYADFCAGEAFDLINHFPAMCNNSMFVAIMSCIEDEMAQICKRVQEFLKLNVSLGDIRGEGLEQAKTYLKRCCNVAVPADGPEWNEIKQLQQVRNVIVHRQGILDNVGENEKHDKVRVYLRAKPTAEIGIMDKIILSKQFCIDAVDVCEAFLHKLLEVLPEAPVAEVVAK